MIKTVKKDVILDIQMQVGTLKNENLHRQHYKLKNDNLSKT